MAGGISAKNKNTKMNTKNTTKTNTNTKINIATGEMSQAITVTPFHFFDYLNFYQ